MKTLDYLNLTNHFGKNVTIDWAEDTTNNSVPLPELGEGGVLVSAPDGRKESTGEPSFPELRHIIKSPATKYQLVMGDGNPGQSWKCIYDNMNNTSHSVQLPEDFPIENLKDMIMFVKYKYPDNDYYSGTLGFIFSWHDAQDYFEEGHSWYADCLTPPQCEVTVSAKDNGSISVWDVTYGLGLQNRALSLYRNESGISLHLSPLSEFKGGGEVPLHITQVFILKDLPVTP
jgi:hypothetical protein